jgi:hypothetical protein
MREKEAGILSSAGPGSRVRSDRCPEKSITVNFKVKNPIVV